MAYDFHYTPTGSGAISGQQVLQQTEDAINELGDYVNDNVGGAMDVAQQALTNSENAVDDAQTALNTANNAEGVAIQAQNDVSNLSGTVTNIGNRVTTAEGNISNLQGRMTTAEGNITNLQGRMTTAEGNIGNLQTAVSTAQATANSAQQTATTARQQSYVFRYSSTALTASSTNSNTLLDNTDNLKVGDKVIDSSGVLFSITAIDTANSTFTIGTALIDLATDRDVVHKSGAETVGGSKTFTDSITFSSVSIADVRWKSLVNQTIDLNDCYITRVGTISGYYSASVSSGSNISNKAANTAFIMLSLTTRYISASDYQIYQIFYGSNNEKYTRTCSNGTWTAWINETDKFVTTDTTQVISGNKTFSSNVNVYNSDSSTDTANIILKNSKAERGSTTNIGEQNIFFLDKDNAQIGNIKCEVDSNGVSILTLQCTHSSNGSSGIRLRRTSIGTSLHPVYNNGCNLGTSAYKWYDVQTRAVNNLEPSSLSLPSGNANDVIDISSYITALDGTFNSYTVPANGWISIAVVGIAIAIISSSWSDSRLRESSGNVRMLYPVLKNETLDISVTGPTLVYARFIPCQGNV